MRKLSIIGVTIAALVAAGCGENYEAVQGENKVLVRDSDGGLDRRAINYACERQNEVVIEVQSVGEDAVLVTCGAR